MLRILSYVVVVALAVSGAVWLADRPGAVSVEWLGWHLETSVPVLLAILFIIAAVLTMALRVFAGLARLPGRWAGWRREGRRRKGYQALTDGLVAAAAGESGRARKLAGRAQRLLADPSLTTFLSAQAAQLSGDVALARDHYTAMLDRPETASLGLRGLLTQALERGDDATAIDLAQRSRLIAPADPWLVDTLFTLLVKADRLREAQELTVDAAKRKALPAAEAGRRRALVLNERSARAAAEGDSAAADFARQALKADPGLTAAAVRLASAMASLGKERRAAALLERAWERQPAAELAHAYANLRPGEAPLQRVRRLDKLVARYPGHPESHLAIAAASLEAKLWGQARKHLLEAVEARPSARPYRLLARLEQAEFNNGDAARAWLAKAAEAAADPAWHCAACGVTLPEWSLSCPQCGAVDRLTWSSLRPAGSDVVVAGKA